MAEVDPSVRIPTSIVFTDDALVVDGASIDLRIIPQLLYELAHPDPRKWYRLERVNNNIIVHVKVTENSNGTPIARINGQREEDPGRQGSEAPHARGTSTPN